MEWWRTFLRALSAWIADAAGTAQLAEPAGAAQVAAPTAEAQGVPLPLRPDGTPYRYHAFLSHASADKERVRQLYQRLTAEGFSLWFDETHIGWGQSIRRAVNDGLSESRHVILFVSRASVEREWVEFEVLVKAMGDPANRERSLLPLVIDDVAVPATIAPFRYLSYRDEGEREVAHWTLTHTLRGGEGTRAPGVGDAPAVLSTDEHRDVLSRYRSLLAHQHRRFPLVGLGASLNVEMMMAQTWVELRGHWQSPDHAGKSYGAAHLVLGELDGEGGEVGSEGPRTLNLETAFREVRRRAGVDRGVVVVGDPGSGKTTLLRQMLLLCLERGSTYLGLEPDLVPVWLPLRQLESTDQGLEPFVQASLGQSPFLSDMQDLGTRLFKRGGLLLLLDGLDEVADVGTRARVCEWIRQAQHKRPSWRFAVTSRYSGWRSGDLGPSFTELHITPFEDEQSRQFISNWFTSVMLYKRGLGPSAHAEAQVAADTLWSRLKAERASSRRLMAMTRNPLMLTLLCLIQYDSGALPKERHRLYQRCVQVLLKDWRESAQVRMPWRAEDAQAQLEPAAWKMIQTEQLHASEGELIEWLTSGDGSLPTPPLPEQARVFLRDVRDRSGLLVGWSQDHYGFIHKTFAEYLAARVIVRRGEMPSLAERFGQEWWEEVTLQALALDPPESPQGDTFMRALLRSPAFMRYPNLVGEVLEDAAQLTPAPFIEALEDGAALSWDVRVRVMGLLAGRWPEQSAIDRAVLAVARRERRWVEALEPQQRQQVLTAANSLLQERGVEVRIVITPRQPQLGDTLYHEKTGITLVWVPAGSFVMGEDDFGEEWAEMLKRDLPNITPDDVAALRRNAAPAHRVTLSQGFWLGRVPVTNEQYRRFVDATGHRPSQYDGLSRFNAPDQPVVAVDWDDAQAFCAWAEMKLPTEAQWEFAARGPEGRPYPWGEAHPSHDRANFGRKVGKTSPVGSYPEGASWVGALDMAGNVWEWCADWDDGKYYATLKDGATDPGGPPSGSDRVIRGGSWLSDAGGLRAALRNGGDPSRRFYGLGFRVVLPSPTAQ